jgi:hypothetical protein
MRAARRLAVTMLSAVSRRLSPDDRDWGQAMLRELDAIDSDWAAVSWALGSTAALFRQSVRHGWKPLGGILWGAGIGAAVFAISAGGLMRVVFYEFPAWRAPVAEWLMAIGLPELVFVVAAVALWRSKRSVATGLVLAAITLMIHFVVHATQG